MEIDDDIFTEALEFSVEGLSDDLLLEGYERSMLGDPILNNIRGAQGKGDMILDFIISEILYRNLFQ